MPNRFIELLKLNATKIIETHISWVILTGTFAYKIKKPVNLGFQDFTTLEKRKYYCEEEVVLNQRLAPSLYLGVVPIIDEKGTPIEYAIKMHEFPQESLLSTLAKRSNLTLPIIDSIATQMAAFHEQAARCDPTESYGSPEDVLSPVQENFKVLRELDAGKPYLSNIAKIEAWANEQAHRYGTLLQKRKDNGFIRACHGDLHLGNIVLIDNQPLIFDCIEFNEAFRWTDVMGDTAFLAMDLDLFGLHDLSHYFVNRYAELTLDYEGILLLRFYQCYRAMVRAKVSAYMSDNENLRRFITLAESYTYAPSPSLTITFGVSGSGKTFGSEQFIMKTGAIRLRSDLFRLQLFSNKNTRYSEHATQQVYQTLLEKARMLLQAGHSVIIDAACLKHWQRELFLNLSQELNIPFHIFAFEAPIEVLQQRITARERQGNDPSEATIEVLQKQLNEREPLSKDEALFRKK